MFRLKFPPKTRLPNEWTGGHLLDSRPYLAAARRPRGWGRGGGGGGGGGGGPGSLGIPPPTAIGFLLHLVAGVIYNGAGWSVSGSHIHEGDTRTRRTTKKRLLL